jgi:hypothetical protein
MCISEKEDVVRCYRRKGEKGLADGFDFRQAIIPETAGGIFQGKTGRREFKNRSLSGIPCGQSQREADIQAMV